MLVPESHSIIINETKISFTNNVFQILLTYIFLLIHIFPRIGIIHHILKFINSLLLFGSE